MDQLFNDHAPSRGVIEFGRFRVLREMLQQNLAKAIDYYRTSRTWIDSRHPLNILLGSIDASITLEPEVFNGRVVDQTFEIAKILNYTSPVSVGTIREKSMLYGDGTAEAVILSIDPYDTFNITKNWRELAPIRVLRHPRTDMWLWPLNGNNPSSEGGIACLDINLPMLASQYRMWMLTEARLSDGGMDLMSTFLSRYPLNNALTSHFDLAFFNRLRAIFLGEPVSTEDSKSPFYQIDYSAKVDQILKGEVGVLSDKRSTFDAILSQIPCITADNLSKAYRTPNRGLFVRSSNWFNALYRLPLISFLVQVNARNNNQANSHYLSILRRFFIATSNDRTMIQMVPAPYRRMVADEIKLGILPYLQISNTN